MSHYNTSFCSDEELLAELNKLGYDDVPPEVFERMKNDLSDLIAKDKIDPINLAENQYDPSLSEYGYDKESPQSSKYVSATSDDLGEWHATQENYRKADSHVSRKTKKKSQKTSLRHLNSQNDEMLEYSRLQDTERNSHTSFEHSINDEHEISELKISQDERVNVNKLKSNDIYAPRKSKIDHNRNEDIEYSTVPKRTLPKENEFESSYFCDDGQRSSVSVAKIRNKNTKEIKPTKSWEKIPKPSDTQNTLNDNTLAGINQAFKAFNLDDYCDPDESATNYPNSSDINLNTSNSAISEKKTIKRKLLRRRNGRSVITETLVECPSYFDTSYPETENLNSSKSFSSDDLSYQSNSSTGSISALSPELSIKSSPSTFSLTSRSTSLRISSTRKKKSDPVAMYNYYKKFWDNFKPPGENTRDRLRWAVRDKMLEYHI